MNPRHVLPLLLVGASCLAAELMEALRPDVDRAALMRPEDIADAVLFLLSLSPTAAVDEIYIRRRSSAPF